MNLKALSNETLVRTAEEIAEAERNKLTELLHYLREIDGRRLYADLGHPSLFDFVVRRLRYSEDQACRRISAMRLIRDVPEVEEKIASGDLTLTNLAIAETLFRRERRMGRPFTPSAKRRFLKTIEGKSTRETERQAAIISPEPLRPDSVRPVSEDRVELRFYVSLDAFEKIERVKGLLAHSNPEMSLGALVEKLCDLQIARLDKSLAPPGAPQVGGTPSVASIRRQVWKRDGGCCRNCGSRYAVQIDHITPRALGGGDTEDNLRLLCRHCNQRAAIKSFGRKKMSAYIRSKSVDYLSDGGP